MGFWLCNFSFQQVACAESSPLEGLPISGKKPEIKKDLSPRALLLGLRGENVLQRSETDSEGGSLGAAASSAIDQLQLAGET